MSIARDFTKNKSKGFGFVEFDLPEDCADALENMDGAELNGHTLRCNIAKQAPNEAGKPIWSAEEWIKNNLSLLENEDKS